MRRCDFSPESYTKTKNICHSSLTLGGMSKVSIGLSVLLAIATVVSSYLYVPNSASATECANGTSPRQCNLTFQVNVQEALSVSITAPQDGASGTPGDEAGTWSTGFLRNTVTLEVSSNNSTGFTASMYANTAATGNTSLVNQSLATATLPTLTSSVTRGDFPDNYWGYSLDTTGDDASTSTYTYNGKVYNETTAGNDSSYYHPLTDSSNPVTVLTGTTGSSVASGTRDIYFGASADLSQASGTYSGTVVISVVTGEVKDNNSSGSEPTTPTDPATSSDDTANDSVATYDSSNGRSRTIYTTTSSDATSSPATTTTTTEISAGDTTSSYASPQGVIEQTYSSNIATGNSLATGFAVAASVAAASGLFFFIAAKRRDDDDDEEEEV